MAETNDPQEGVFEGTRLDAPNNAQSKLDQQGALEGRPAIVSGN